MDEAAVSVQRRLPTDLTRISLRENWWVVIPFAALVVALQSYGS